MRDVSRQRGTFWNRIRKTLTGFSNRRPDKIKNYFQRGFGVEQDVFKVLQLGIFPPGWDASLVEVVAVLSVGTSTLPFSEVIGMLDRILDAGWTGKNVEAFAQLLMETSRAFYGQGWDREAGRLLKIGEIAARRHRQKAVEAQFRREIDRRTVNRLRDQPFLPSRG